MPGALFVESFDTMTPQALAAIGRFSAVGLGVVSTSSRTNNGVTGTTGATEAQNSLRSRTFNPVTPSTGSQGFAISVASNPAAETRLWTLIADDASVQLTVTITPTRTVRVYRGTMESGTLLGSSGLQFFESTYRYLEIGFELTGEGRVEVRSHPPQTGSPLVSGTPRVFVVTGGTSARAWAQSAFYLTDEIVLDDLYINDTPPASSPTFLGNMTISVVRPLTVALHESEFNLHPWIPSSGSDLAAMVDDPLMDFDSTYLYVRNGFSVLVFNMEQLPEDERNVIEAEMTVVTRLVSSARPSGAVGHMWRYDGVFLPANELIGFTSTSYVALIHPWVRTAGFGGAVPTIPQLNASRFGFKS